MNGSAFHRLMVLAAVAGLTAAPALADGVRNTVERVQDNADLRQDHRQQRDDLRDLGHLRSLAERYDAARVAGDVAVLGRLDHEMQVALAREQGESRAELAGDRAEVRRDNREVRGSRRELLRDVHDGSSAVERRDDRRDLRDDRRDRRDDRRDARLEKRSLERRSEIATEWRGLAGGFDEPSLDRKRALIDELIVMAEAETVANRQEVREDRRERREDRRERREDRGGGF